MLWISTSPKTKVKAAQEKIWEWWGELRERHYVQFLEMTKPLVRLDIHYFCLVFVIYEVKHGWDLERPPEGKMPMVFLKPCRPCLEKAVQLFAALQIQWTLCLWDYCGKKRIRTAHRTNAILTLYTSLQAWELFYPKPRHANVPLSHCLVP